MSSSRSGARKSRGRQRIEMKKMSNESNLQVTFSKRRSGLFKKASELCTLCGADVALVVFSPGQKVFSFGHPNVETVMDRYLSRASTLPNLSGTLQFIEAHRNANVRDFNSRLMQVNNQLETEKQRSDHLNHFHKVAMNQFWWALPIENMSKTQLNQFRAALENLKKSVAQHVNSLFVHESINNPNQFFGQSSSNALVPHQPSPPPLLPPPPPSAQLVPQLFGNGPHFLQHQSPMMLHESPMMQNHMFNMNNIGQFGSSAAGFL
ncbi:agamous-like MADS-box protein AGL62 [Arachis ipaensis]|uniref:agamous-like MADS-box protein AGL62 n=1 Tax=Arachis ipaensis TaxID=130454 RepID=UPI0007AEFD51|nr:agamous-like MADS-box protein AGL62 [Arachis ipaensis]XP_025679205.1 agamous-like MADS-box protein AGL62 [Arachis hypogaea]